MRWETRYDLALLTVFAGGLLVAVGMVAVFLFGGTVWFGLVMPPNDIASPSDAGKAFGSMVAGFLAVLLGTATVVWGRRNASKLKQSVPPAATALLAKAPRR